MVRIHSLHRHSLLLLLMLCFSATNIAYAHSPHDDLRVLGVSPGYRHDKTLFAYISGHLMRSQDGGFSWKELRRGLDFAGGVTDVALSPDFESDGTVLVSNLGSGIYRSTDRGDSWAPSSDGLEFMEIASVAFLSSGAVIAADTAGGLAVSDDNGGHWEPSMHSEAPITALAYADGAGGGAIYAANSDGILYVSRDGGKQWQAVYRFEGSGGVTSLSVSPDSGVIFAGTQQHGVFKSTDGGVSFEEKNTGIDGSYIVDVSLSPRYDSDSTVFLSTWYKAIYESRDGGDTWQIHAEGLTTDEQADTPKYKSPYFNRIRFADDAMFLCGFDGLFRSNDGGKTWAQLETLYVGLIKGLGVAPGTKGQEVAISTYGGGSYVSYDEGGTWEIKNRGLTTTRLSDIAFSPQFSTDNTMFSGAQGALLRSTKRDDAWERIALFHGNWPQKIRTKIAGLLVKIGVERKLARKVLLKRDTYLVYPTSIAVSPDFERDGTVFFGTRWHGIYKSTDRGTTSSGVWDATGKVVPNVAISPDYANDKTVFAGIRDLGVYRSQDGGESWEPANKGLAEIADWETSSKGSTTVRDISLVFSPAYNTDRTLFAASSTGIYATSDSGDNWSRLPGVPAGVVNVLAVSPDYQHDGTLLVSIRGRGLYRSTDKGKSFTPYAHELISGNYDIVMIAFSGNYASDRTLYAASDEELFISRDAGQSWQRVRRPVRYENHREVVIYSGDWAMVKGPEYSASSISQASSAGSRVSLPFVGTGISWIGRTSDKAGIGKVYIDGVYRGDVDQYSNDSPADKAVTSFSVDGLPAGAHTIAVEVTGEKNPDSKGTDVTVDAFDIVR